MRPGRTISLLLSAGALLVLDARADDVAPADASREVVAPALAPAAAAPAAGWSRRVYGADDEDVGMIVGGASEDAKAKVGRLPIQD